MLPPDEIYVFAVNSKVCNDSEIKLFLLVTSYHFLFFSQNLINKKIDKLCIFSHGIRISV